MNSSSRLKNIIRKEWTLSFSQLNQILMIILLPLLVIAQFIVIIYLAANYLSPAMESTILGKALAQFIISIPKLGELPLKEQFLVYFYLQLPLYILLVPMMIANILSTTSIIEEKQTRTLEPLLATPVRTWELLLGKALAGAIPTYVVTLLSTFLALLSILLIGLPHLLAYILQPFWLISLLAIVPLITLLSFLLGVIGSSKANDLKTAQNYALLEVLPFLVIVGLQVVGIIPLRTYSFLSLALLLLVVDFFVLRLSVSLFGRESILTKWR